ncbi:MAG: O-antigen ligase family protein [Chloroflexota bacterium]
MPLLLGAIAVVAGLASAIAPVLSMAILAVAIVALAISLSPISALALMLCVAPLRTLITTESALQLPLDVGQIAFVVFVFVWWIHRIIRKQQAFHVTQSPLLIAVGAFTVAIGMTAFVAFSLQFWMTEWLKWVVVLATMILIMDLGRHRRWETIVGVLVASGITNALVGLYIFFGGSGADHLLINGQYFRAFGTFGQPNPFGGFLGLLVPIAVVMAWGYLMQGWQIWQATKKLAWGKLPFLLYYAGGAVVMLGGIVASWSRGAWLGFVVSMAVVAFCLPRKLWQSLLLSGSALTIVTGLWFGGLIPDSIQQRVLSSTEELFSFSDVRGVDITTSNYAIVERLAHWQAAMNMTQEHPWLGVGFGNYEVAYAQFQLINWDFPLGHAHNYYLNILAEAGIIGFLFYAGMWLCIVWVTWYGRQHPDVLMRSLVVGLMGSWAYLAFHSLLDNLYVNNVFLHLGVMLGLLALAYHQRNEIIQRGYYVTSE